MYRNKNNSDDDDDNISQRIVGRSVPNGNKPQLANKNNSARYNNKLEDSDDEKEKIENKRPNFQQNLSILAKPPTGRFNQSPNNSSRRTPTINNASQSKSDEDDDDNESYDKFNKTKSRSKYGGNAREQVDNNEENSDDNDDNSYKRDNSDDDNNDNRLNKTSFRDKNNYDIKHRKDNESEDEPTNLSYAKGRYNTESKKYTQEIDKKEDLKYTNARTRITDSFKKPNFDEDYENDKPISSRKGVKYAGNIKTHDSDEEDELNRKTYKINEKPYTVNKFNNRNVEKDDDNINKPIIEKNAKSPRNRDSDDEYETKNNSVKMPSKYKEQEMKSSNYYDNKYNDENENDNMKNKARFGIHEKENKIQSKTNFKSNSNNEWNEYSTVSTESNKKTSDERLSRYDKTKSEDMYFNNKPKSILKKDLNSDDEANENVKISQNTGSPIISKRLSPIANIKSARNGDYNTNETNMRQKIQIDTDIDRKKLTNISKDQDDALLDLKKSFNTNDVKNYGNVTGLKSLSTGNTKASSVDRLNTHSAYNNQHNYDFTDANKSDIKKHSSVNNLNNFETMSDRSSSLLNTSNLRIKEAKNRSFLVGSSSSGGGKGLLSAYELDKNLTERKARMLIITWNMNEMKTFPEKLVELVLPDNIETMPDIYAIGCQEFAMNQKEWEIKLQELIGPSHVKFASFYYGSVGLNLFIRRELIWFCSVVDFEAINLKGSVKAPVRTKASIVASFQLFGTSICLICSHFESGDDKLEQRIDNYKTTINNMTLPKTVTRQQDIVDGDNTTNFDCVFWFGDLNFRSTKERDKVVKKVFDVKDRKSSNFEEILQHDELYKILHNNTAFNAFLEPKITFEPTYKYDLNTDEFDTSSKCRIPSYCDRILYKSKSKNAISCSHYDLIKQLKSSDHRAVYALVEVKIRPGVDKIQLLFGNFDRDVYISGYRKRQMHNAYDIGFNNSTVKGRDSSVKHRNKSALNAICPIQ